MGLNHVSLTVSDLGRSAAFYERCFGFTRRLREEPDTLLLADEDGSVLALTSGEPLGEPGRYFHFGVQVGTVDDVHATRRALAEAGHCRLRVADPDGCPIDVFNG